MNAASSRRQLVVPSSLPFFRRVAAFARRCGSALLLATCSDTRCADASCGGVCLGAFPIGAGFPCCDAALDVCCRLFVACRRCFGVCSHLGLSSDLSPSYHATMRRASVGIHVADHALYQSVTQRDYATSCAVLRGVIRWDTDEIGNTTMITIHIQGSRTPIRVADEQADEITKTDGVMDWIELDGWCGISMEDGREAVVVRAGDVNALRRGRRAMGW